MGLGRRRIGVLVGSGVMAVGVAALVLAAVGVFAGTAAAPTVTHRAAIATTTTTTAPPAGARGRHASGQHAGRHDGRRHPRVRVAAGGRT